MPEDATPEDEVPATPDAADPPEDELRRRFRAALDNKHGSRGAQNRGHESGHGPTLRSNDKRQRTFRRKAGG